ncbi:MAG TPA: glycerophosphodiester phosphodiesterase [Blastocatellia bacterium]|nr:glycerophosphodiester phosphodiesterase [Blastocatellia bacterium]
MPSHGLIPSSPPRAPKRSRSVAVRAALLFFVSLVGTVIVGVPAQSVPPASPRPPKPLVIAHRGGAMESTENTIGAFQRATRLGADGIETDIRLTRDGVVVIYHDEKFGRVEGLAPAQRTRLVSDLTYAELSRQTLLPVGEDTGGRRVPTLNDLLASVRSGLLNIEIKRGARFNELVNKTAEILRRFDGLDRVVLETPDLATAQKLRNAIGPRLKLHINPDYDGSASFDASLERVLKFKPHSISVSQKKVSLELIDKAHKAGVEVWTWTVNSPDIGKAMALMGVDAIKTDRPSMLLDLLRDSRQRGRQ